MLIMKLNVVKYYQLKIYLKIYRTEKIKKLDKNYKNKIPNKLTLNEIKHKLYNL